MRVLTISLILVCLGILLFCQISVYAQSDEDVRRTSSIIPFLSYPVYGMGAGVLPYTQQISAVQNTPLTSSVMNAYHYRDPLSMYGTQSTQFANPFMVYGSNAMVYADTFSQAQAQSTSYSNILGVNINQGQGFYRDPLYMTAGKYMNYSSPVGGYSFDQAIAQSPFGGATHVSSELLTPMTYYGTEINTAYGAGAIGFMPAVSSGVNVQHAAIGAPLTELQGTMLLKATGLELSAMNRDLSNQYMYTAEGMPFYANAAYFNPDSYGGSNWYFPGEISSYEAGGVTAGGITTGYAVTEEISGASYLPVYGGSFASYRVPAGTVDGTALSAGGAYGGWAGSGESLAGWGTVSGGWGVPSGAVFGTTSGLIGGAATTGATSAGGSGTIFSGWGVPSGAVFGTTSGGAWGSGGIMGGGIMGGGIMGGGGFVSGSGVSYGGAPGLAW